MASGNSSPETPWWISWPIIILLFATGLTPVALALMFIRIFGDDSKRNKKTSTSSFPGRDTAAQETIKKMQTKAEEEKKSTKKKKNSSRTVKLLRVFGIILAVIAVFAGAEAVAGLLDGWTFYMEDLLQSIAMGGFGVGMVARAQFLVNRDRLITRYKKAIGREKCIDIATIAKRVNRTPEKCAKELQKLLDKGFLSDDFYIDYEKQMFLKFGCEPEPEPEPAPVPPEVDQGYSGVLRNLRRANDRIADEELSRKIDRLEQISGLIFKAVDEDPSKRDRIRSFFDYYLPTTQKLLDAYADFDEIGVDGEHLREAKERIEATMDGIVEGFEHQLDQLYSADAMDVVSDVKVMETILNRDTASVAKDFGMVDDPKPKTAPKPKAAPKPQAAKPAEQKSDEHLEQQTML